MNISEASRKFLRQGFLLDIPTKILKTLQHGSSTSYLDTLSALALDPRYTSLIFVTHEAIFVEICSRWLQKLRLDPNVDPLTAVVAIAQVLPVAPHLSVYAKELLLHQRPGILQVFASRKVTALMEVPSESLHLLLLSMYRLLKFENKGFEAIVCPAQLQVILSHPQHSIRYLAIRIFCLYLHASDAAMSQMINRYCSQNEIAGAWEDKIIDYVFLTLWEEKRLKELAQALIDSRNDCQTSNGHHSITRILVSHDFSPQTALMGNVLVPRLAGKPLDQSLMVLTDTSIRNVSIFAQAINQEQPLLLTGPAGCGKTLLVDTVSRELGKSDSIVTLHLNEQTDAKLLIGMYTSADTPGSFTWRPGVLTKAVAEGRWVLIEDLDRAPTEILSTLLPLLERKELLVPHWGGNIPAAVGFKMIATIRTNNFSNEKEILPRLDMLGIRHWLRVPLRMHTDEDLARIITIRFPVLHAYVSKICKLYNDLAQPKTDDHFVVKNSFNTARGLGPQDLFKLCRRLEDLLIKAGVESGNEPISELLNDMIFLETVDCFAAQFPQGATKSHIVNLISQKLHIHPSRAKFCLEDRKPDYVDNELILQIGRANILKRNPNHPNHSKQRVHKAPFAMTAPVLRVLESFAVAIRMAEPCLLIGETGTGKTTLVQQLADILGYKLTVVNLSQQTEAGDLLGGYKPLNIRAITVPMKEEFEDLFESTFSSKRNRNYLNSIGNAISKGRWQRAITLWLEAVRSIEDTFETSKNTTNNPTSDRQPKRRRLDSTKSQKLKSRWDKFALDVEFLRQHVVSGSKGVAFSFVESNIVKAARQGDWVLLDEINLASSDTLESLSDLFSTAPKTPNILLSERGDTERVQAHRNFRIFGSMNPATDVGKKDLPIGLRSKFTEIYIDSPDKYFQNVLSVTKVYLGEKNNHDIWAATGVAHLYLEIKKLVEENRLVDGANQKPHFSFRTLTRTLVYVLDILPIYGLRRALYEGFSMSFLTSLNQESELLLLPLIEKHILGSRNRQAFLYQTPRAPQDDRKYVQFRHYWIAQGDSPPEIQPRYIITPFIERNLLNLVRATSTRRFPVLLQGPTSSGKTSMIEYLARISGNNFVRINNHEHTDLQEYLGSYVSSLNGRLEYQDGILVRALKEGHWIVLDELNLAPTDVLEALNRLLDDNKELWIPETQQIIRPHENFVLFATQNPPGMYGGRKILSRAFRNRFLELHFDDIPEDELETILRERSQIAPSFCTKIVAVYKKLSILRQRDRFFEQRNSFATLRDLFRWALRDADDREQLAVNGFHLLAERVRNVDEREKVKSIIEDVMKLKIDENHMYSFGSSLIPHILHQSGSGGIVWTKSMRRLCVLVTQALRRNEPVLLVGETGSGKTTICQVVANLMSTKLHILNAHQNMETGDLIGAQRPVRNRASIEKQLIVDISSILMEYSLYKEDSAKTLLELLEAYDALLQRGDHSIPNNLRSCIEQNRVRLKALFEWSDSNLVSAMQQGEPFLLDEISLADDSVLERLNSVLETDRKLLLAEKGSTDVLITASPGFQFLATMNPGGDYGKRELSPALRNRFTEIWVPQITEHDEIAEIVSAKLLPPLHIYAASMIDFAIWYQKTYKSTISAISIREILAWIEFVNKFYSVDPYFALLHGAAMLYIDCLGANPAAKVSVPESEIPVQRQICLRKLEELFDHPMIYLYNQEYQISFDDHSLSFGPFSIEGPGTSHHNSNYILNAPTIVRNMMKLTRALQLEKPILLEGSPGVGKTTLVIALANATGNTLARINLSEQTDLMDLFGSDIPVEEDDIGQFSWRDAPFLRAMQTGQWVLLDEMNLASQAVLEGLNACFDHRGEIYIPELDQTFKKHPRFTVFAAQNPHHQGGGRKGLPASFVNRFTVVYADTFTAEDLVMISSRSYPTFSAELTKSLVSCVTSVSHLLQTNRRIGIRGAPWEINLRDILRWSDLLNSSDMIMSAGSAKDYQKILFLQRFRTFEDIAAVSQLLETYVLQDKRIIGGFHHTSSRYMQVGLALIARDPISQPVYCQDLKSYSINLSVAESVLLCVQKNWPCLLVGPSGCGKSQSVFQLASKIGADVVSLPLNADMDTIDLIGGYEQVDCHRETVGLITKLRQVVCRHFVESLASFPERSKEFASIDERFATVKPGIQELQEIAGLIQRLEEDDPNLRFSNILEQCQIFLQRLSGNYKGRFEWIDGILVKALKQGQWLILDNANLCASSVLDRLNSLLEPDGFLSINEYRTLDGAAHMVKPHPNFRIFLTMDPRHGELSRSMRNRCIELFMPGQPLIEMKTCFSSSESFISRFQILESINWDEPNFVNFHALLSVCLDYLTIADYKWSDQWQKEVVKGLIKLPASRQNLFISALSVRKQILTSNTILIHSLKQVHEELFKNLGLSNFEDMQMINPLSNPVHFSMAVRQIRPDLGLLSQFFDLTVEIYSFEALLNSIRLRTGSEPISQMSRLGWSLVSNNSRSSKYVSTEPLGNFLMDTSMFLRNFIESNDFKSSKRSEDMMLFARQVLSYLRDMKDLASSSEFDESIFQTLLLIGKSIAVRFSDNPELRTLANKLDSNLDSFNPLWQLCTGLSMEVLWKTFRPPLAKNIIQVESRLQVEALANRFDNLKWKVDTSIFELDSLRRSIILLHNTIESTNAGENDSLDEIRKSLEQLECQPETSHHIYMPIFAEQFEALCQYETIEPPKWSKTSSSLLHLLASRPTIYSMGANHLAGSWVLLSQMERYTGILIPRTALMNIKNDFPFSTLKTLRAISEVPMRFLTSLQEEMDVIARNLICVGRFIDRDHLRDLNTILARIFIKICEAHEDYIDCIAYAECVNYLHYYNEISIVDSSTVRKPSLHMKHDISRSHYFTQVIEEYLNPSLEYLHIALNKPSEAVLATSLAWIKFFLGCLYLYMPDRPFDPAMKPMIDLDRHQKRKTELLVKVRALKKFESIFTGQDSNLRSQLVEQQIDALGSEPVMPSVPRPRISEVEQLQGEFNSLLKSIPFSSLKISDLRQVYQGDSAKVGEFELLRVNLAQCISRLSGKFRVYEDITRPLVAMLRGLDTGLAIALLKNPPTAYNNTIKFICELTPFLGMKLRNISTTTFHHLMSYQVQNLDPRFFFLKTIALSKSANQKIESSTMQVVFEVFHTFYHDWKARLETDQRYGVSKSSMYRYRGAQDDFAEADEDDYLKIFPDYISESEDSKKHEKPQFDQQKLTHDVANYQRAIFESSIAASEQLLTTLEDNASEISKMWPGESYIVQSNMTAEHLLCGAVLQLSKIINRLSATATKTYNFYFDANLSEVQKLVGLVRRLQAKFQGLAEAWPEHATIQEVLQTSSELMAMRHTEPVAKILTKTEKLHSFVHEWQRVTSKEFSAADLYDQLSSLLISWRRLELSTWGQLLDIELTKCKEDADSWWFIAYEVIVAVPLSIIRTGEDLRTHAKHLFATLEEFVQTTSIGQYSQRLHLIECFRQQLHPLAEEETSLKIIYNTLVSFLNYYSQFEKPIHNVLHAGRDALNKEMKEVLLLASWKDTNIVALRESAKRSHHQLFKIIRKYRAYLAQPAEKFISKEFPQNHFPTETMIDDAVRSHQSVISPWVFKTCQQYLPDWGSKPVRFVDPLSTAKSILRITQSCSHTFNSAQLLNTYADELIANIKLLQKETPEKATKENESIIKHLKNQKKKLYTDTLKDVRQMGFRSNLSVDTLMKQSSLAAVLVNSPAISADQLPPTFEAAEYDFHKLMHQMPYVRQQVRNHCEDLAPRDVNKSIGLLESMLTLIIKQRNISTSVLSDLCNLDEIIKLMHNLEKPESPRILRESESRKNLRRETQNLISWLPSILDAGIRLIQNFDKLTQTDSTVVTSNLEHHKDKIQTLAKVYESLPDVPIGLSLSKHEEVDDEASQTLGVLNTGIQNLSNDHPNLRFVLRQIGVWTIIDIDPPHNKIKEEERMSLSDFDTKISKTLDSILVAIQQLGEIFTIGSFSPKDSGWLTNSESTLTSCLQVLHPRKIVRLLEAASSSIHRIESSNGNELSVAAALCALAMPILQQYRSALDNLLTCNVKFNTSLCRLTCVLAQSFCQVASEGFCSPADNSSAETGNTEKLEEGTGLGEGSGAKDISQDIQNDEDLSELAEQPNKEKNSPEVEAQDKAVNMDQEELEGNLEKTSSQREDGDSGSQGEEMDLDEESGKVDDLDPSAVDEKLWDGNTDKTEREKEASQNNTGTKQNKQVAAEANETKNGENDEMSDEMVEESEQVAQETEKLDPRLQEEQKLDLPEGMNLSDDEVSSEISGSDEDLEQDSDDDDQNNLEDKRLDVTDDENENMDSEKDADDVGELELSKESAEKLEEDTDKTNIADSPSHVDPEEGDIIDQNLLLALPEDAHTGQDSNFPNGAQGLDQRENQQSEAQNQEANAQGEEKSKGSKAKSINADRIAEEASSSQAEEKAENGQGQNSHPEESIRSQAIKKLGDALERWHRQHREIQEAKEVPREDYLGKSDNDMAEQDFEHLSDENQADTQALGAASQDQARALDEQAFDTQMQDRVSEFMPDEVSSQKDKELDDPKHSLESQADQEIPYTDSRTGALLVENDTRNHSLLESNAATLQEENEIDDLDTSLSITHLQPSTPRIPCSPAEALRLWTYYETLTHNLSLILTEQLRLILAPTLATKMRGDFRTGKRLNIKRIIPYIASNYKRDKIWMRRSVPSKRAYQILLAVDDSKSMSERSGSHLAFETLALLCKSLSMLEVGEISVVGFGTDVHVAHAFDKPFSADAGINVFQQFSFQQATTDVKKLLRESISLFRKARGSSARAGASDLWQLQLIISDGVCEDHESIRQLVRRAQEERIVIVFVIVDAGTNESILDMSQAVFETEDSTAAAAAAAASAFPMEAYNGGGGEGNALGMRGAKTPTLKIKRYLDGFPFPYYLVVGDVRDLPGVLATALKQWFAEVVESH